MRVFLIVFFVFLSGTISAFANDREMKYRGISDATQKMTDKGDKLYKNRWIESDKIRIQSSMPDDKTSDFLTNYIRKGSSIDAKR